MLNEFFERHRGNIRMQLAIFGAQGYALGAYEAIKTLYPKRVIPCFHVSKMGNNAPMLGSIPVKELASFSLEMSKEDKRDIEVIIILQVGAANTDRMIADLLDNKGENISKKNVNYSELTGLYWIWKNKLGLPGSPEGDEGQYYGVAQYKRMLTFSDDDLLRLRIMMLMWFFPTLCLMNPIFMHIMNGI